MYIYCENEGGGEDDDRDNENTFTTYKNLNL